ncbi:kinase-like domain-containing protein [Hygrophoropsis aurantiaca]|uniref:Kinase-like domain-containing protein n=1 Tax=Hygrophoropsis aurantiaca TaxID=72124 RepID=A0ACB8AH44_9AGAM|nr:kinase-like domain-containing protein [Hygrophoropsis aurantiaca]
MSIPGVINGQFVVGKQIARGAYSTIFQGTNLQTNQTVAIKFGLTNIDDAQLDREAKALKLTDGTIGVPRAYYFGREGPYNVLVTDQFGLGMGELFETCNRKLSIKSVCMIARLMIKRIQAVHEKGVLHRYIRPENFMFGKPESEEANVLHVIAFGLAKQYRDPETQHHIPYAEGFRFFGSAPFMSINAHLGRQQSRRDDLESIGYVLIYLLLGTLPWMERSSPDTSVRVLYGKVSEKMQTISISDLCDGFPCAFTFPMFACRV